MKFPFIGLTLFFMVSAPIATQATDFQIDKIVTEALAKAQAGQSVSQTPDVVTKSQSTIALSNDHTKDFPATPPNVDLKTQKTDLQNDPSKGN